MEQSKLRVGLMVDCGALLNEKLSSNVYGLDFDYWV
jgi:hypothetical protein